VNTCTPPAHRDGGTHSTPHTTTYFVLRSVWGVGAEDEFFKLNCRIVCKHKEGQSE